jgi:hypothetical protein
VQAWQSLFFGLSAALIVTVVIGVTLLLFQWEHRSRPNDILVIKERLEANSYQVIDIQRAGFDMGGRISPSYRKYRVTVRPLGGGPDEARMVGVPTGLFSSRQIREF